MKNLSVDHITECLSAYSLPDLDRDLVSAKAVRKIEILGDTVHLQLQLGYPCNTEIEAMKQSIVDYLRLKLDMAIELDLSWQIQEYKIGSGLTGLSNVKNIIAVASGKGGVGKSTSAVNLALALHAEGAKVGILDADIYGPSIPTMMGLKGKPESLDGKTLEPLTSYGIEFMSIGSLIPEDQAMIWRGPIISKTLQQIMRDTNWHNLDYLIIDLPPGTGDTQLTMAQKIPVTAGIIVTTPQDIALQDAKRGLLMFNKVNIPVLGIMENMSTHVCSNCGHEEAIFGSGGGQRFAKEYEVPLLGQLPLDASVARQADCGKPTVVAEPESALAAQYRAIARRAAAALSLLGRDFSRKFPNIKIVM